MEIEKTLKNLATFWDIYEYMGDERKTLDDIKGHLMKDLGKPESTARAHISAFLRSGHGVVYRDGEYYFMELDLVFLMLEALDEKWHFLQYLSDQEQIEYLEEKINKLEAKSDDLKSRNNSLQKKVTSLKKELEDLNTSSQEAKANYEKQINHLEEIYLEAKSELMEQTTCGPLDHKSGNWLSSIKGRLGL